MLSNNKCIFFSVQKICHYAFSHTVSVVYCLLDPECFRQLQMMMTQPLIRANQIAGLLLKKRMSSQSTVMAGKPQQVSANDIFHYSANCEL